MHNCILKVYLDDEKVLKSIFEALNPDNRILPEGMIISSFIDGNCLIIVINCKERIGSLLNTIDELIASINVGIESIRVSQQTYK